MDSNTSTQSPAGQAPALAVDALFGLLRKMLNKHFTMAADEHREGASDSSVFRHAAEFDAAEAEFRVALLAAIEDRKRLDWLDASTPHIFWSAVCNHPMNPEGECAVATGANEVFYAKTYRASIDAAMRGPNASGQTRPAEPL